MDAKLPERALATHLTRNAILRIDPARDQAIVVFSGDVWITLDDDPRDIVLSRGESFGLDGAQGALVQALRDSTVLVVGRDDRSTEEPEPSFVRALDDGLRRLAAMVRLLRLRWTLGRPPTADPAHG